MLSVIIPANNEEAYIGACLNAILASDEPCTSIEIIVVANGCSDNTACVASGYVDQFAERGWSCRILDLSEGGKMKALNGGDEAAQGENRAYLDADVLVSPPLLAQISAVLQSASPRYTSGTPFVSEARSWTTRAYRRIYRQVPFMQSGVPGFGIFAVNEAGRARWGAFPDIISDDTFVRLQFAPEERIAIPATHQWPMVEGFAKLVKVRRRQDQGVAEIAERFPELLKNDDKQPFGLGKTVGMVCRDPIGFGVYAAVALSVRLTKQQNATAWSRGR